MKIKSLSSFPKSYYVWFFTPLLTFGLYLFANYFAGVPMLLSPVVGCVALSFLLSSPSSSESGVFLLFSELLRGLYIGAIAFIYGWFLQSPGFILGGGNGPSGAFSSAIFFLFISAFFYLITDLLIVFVNLVFRRIFKGVSKNARVTIVSLIGFVCYVLAFYLMLVFFRYFIG